MYVPKHFEEHRPEELHRVIREHPLGILILNSADGLDANHIPFELNEENGQAVLLAHVARANPLWREAKDGDEALVIFRAANAYISPNWYPSKHQFHKQVPTWNYQAVHVQGKSISAMTRSSSGRWSHGSRGPTKPAQAKSDRGR